MYKIQKNTNFTELCPLDWCSGVFKYHTVQVLISTFSWRLCTRWWWWFSCWVVSDSCKPIDCTLSGSSVHGISQARILEWVAISFSRESSRPLEGIKPGSPALQEDIFLVSEPPGKLLSNSQPVFYVQVNEEIQDLNQVSLIIGFVLLFSFMSEPECIEVYLCYWIKFWVLESGWHDCKFWFYSLLAEWPWENYHSLYKHQHFSSIRWG